MHCVLMLILQKTAKIIMNKNRLTYIINILFPCVFFSAIAGFITAAMIFLFKLASSALISLSAQIYDAARADIRLLPILVFGAALLGLFAGILLRKNLDCRGGGIPTAIAALRGYVPLKKVSSVLTIFFSSMLTYFCGVPLGTEGPSVQMGALAGLGTSKIFGKKHPAWSRYIMTGGACAGFSAATGAPITGIFFAFEEAHRRFSPMIFMIASMTVAASTAFTELLSLAFNISPALFHFKIDSILPLKFIWIPLVVGFICGICALFFTNAYRFLRSLLIDKLKNIPFIAKTTVIFALVSTIGFCSKSCIGTGHSLIEELTMGNGIWYMLIIILCVRAILMIVSNTQGVTGGLFVPTLAFGAIIGSVCGKIAVAAGVLPHEYYIIVVIIGMASFLAASSRTPLTALAFAVEALSGMSNVLPITIGVTFAFVVIELMGVPSFSDTVIEGKIEHYNEGLKPLTIDAYLTVAEDSFVIGKEVRDILWPPACVIVSVNNNPSAARIGMGMTTGDVLHVHCRTTHPSITAAELEAIVGKQSFDISERAIPLPKSDEVPDT